MFGPTFTAQGPNQFLLPFGVYTNINPIAAPSGLPYAATLDRILTPIRWTQSFVVAAPNNATNYWLIQLFAHEGGVNIANFNTSTFPANFWQRQVINSFALSPIDPSAGSPTYKLIILQVAATGAPGVIYCAGPMFVVSG